MATAIDSDEQVGLLSDKEAKAARDWQQRNQAKLPRIKLDLFNQLAELKKTETTTTTKRQRRISEFDWVLLKKAAELGAFQVRSRSELSKIENYAIKIKLGFACHPDLRTFRNGSTEEGVYWIKRV